MKILCDNKVFIQGIDLITLIKMPLDLPQSFFTEMSKKYDKVEIQMNVDLLNFSFEVVDWILDQDWILDYDYYKSMSGQTIHEKIDELEALCDKLYSDWERDGDTGENTFDEMSIKVFYRRYQIKELDMLLRYRRSKHRIVFPSGYDDTKAKLWS